MSSAPRPHLRRLLGFFLQTAALIATVFTLPAASLAAAAVLDTPTTFIAIGVLAAFSITFVLSFFALTLIDRQRRFPLAISISLIMTLLVFIGFKFAFLEPLIPEDEQFVADIPEDIELWSLSTGSGIAVRKVAAREDSRHEPIVFLHGGPGAYSVSLRLTVATISHLSNDGHDVYFYDQVGGGLSERLDDISHYSIDRHLDDLKAIYDRIGSEQIILIGSSGGATLGANFMARHPRHVSAAIFSGPGPLFHPDWADKNDGGLDEQMAPKEREAFEKMVETPRLFAALALTEINPKAAVNFASEAELGSLFDKVANDFYLSLAVCPRSSVDVVSSGYGFWSNRMTGKSLKSAKIDPKPALRKNSTPVLVLRGACDYKNEAVARDYADVFPNSEFTLFENAGHMLFWEQPDQYILTVRQFLNDLKRKGPRAQ